MDRNASIHGLRGLAVLAVFVYHVHRSVVTGGFGIDFEPNCLGFRLLESGRLGVELFFLISGYLITGSLLRHRSARTFLWGRAVRIYPAFLPLHLLLFSAGPMIGYGWMADLTGSSYALHFVSNLLFLPGVFDLPIAQIVAWSLSYELAFYLLAATGWRCVIQRGFAWRAALSGSWGLATGLLLWHHPRAWFFVAGALACALMRSSQGRALARRLAMLDLPAVLLMAALFDGAFGLAVVCGCVALIGVACEGGLLARFLRRRPLQFLADVSYSFYLWHAVVLFATKRIFAEGPIQNAYLNVALFSVISAVGSLVPAYASWKLIEQRKWLRRPPAVHGFEREAAAIAVWRRSLEQTRLEAAAQSVTMEPVPMAVLCDVEAIRGERERDSGGSGDRTQTGGEEENPPQEAAALCADRP